MANYEAIGSRYRSHPTLAPENFGLFQTSFYVGHPDVDKNMPVIVLASTDTAADPAAVAAVMRSMKP